MVVYMLQSRRKLSVELKFGNKNAGKLQTHMRFIYSHVMDEQKVRKRMKKLSSNVSAGVSPSRPSITNGQNLIYNMSKASPIY